MFSHQKSLRLKHFQTVFMLALAIILAVPAHARRVHVTGRISDEHGQPVELATINDERTMQSAISDLKGRYSLNVTALDDTLRLLFRMIGHETRRRVMAVTQDTVQIDMLLPTLSNTLDGVEIRSTRRQTDGMQMVNASGLNFAPQTGAGAVESIIATQAGVSSHNELSSQYSVRGGNFDENSVYVNGTEIFRPMLVHSGQQEGLSFINPDMVGSIRFSTGAFGVEYQDRMASVLDISYRMPKGFEYSLAGSLLGGSAYAGYGGKKFSISGSVRYKTTTYLLGTLDTNGEYDPRFLDFQTFANWMPGSGWELSLTANAARNQYRFSPTDRTTSFGTSESPHQFKVYYEGWENDSYNNSTLALDIKKTVGKSQYRLNASTFDSRESESYDILSQYWIDSDDAAGSLAIGSFMQHARNRLDTRITAMSMRARHSSSILGRIDWGVEYRHENVDDHSSQWEMRDSAGYTLPAAVGGTMHLTSTLKADRNVTGSRASAYIQDTYRIDGNWGLFSINAGVRSSWWTWNRQTTLSPRFIASLQPAAVDNMTLRLSAGIYHQAPFYREFRDTVLVGYTAFTSLNHDIKSQRSMQFVLGGDYDFQVFDRPFRFTAEVYLKKLDRLITYTVDNVRTVYSGRNDAHGYAAGLDMKLFGEFVPGRQSWLTLSIMDTKECADGVWLPRPTDQRYCLSMYFTDTFPRRDRWNMSLKASLADGLPFSSPGSRDCQFRAPAYKRIDIGLSYKVLDSQRLPHVYGRRSLLGDIWVGADCLNLIGVNNVNSYYWVTDVVGTSYAVPNYLTGRQFNLRISISTPRQ